MKFGLPAKEIEDVEAKRQARDLAQANLDAAERKLAEIEEAAAKVAEERVALPYDEASIEQHLQREKEVELKHEIATRMLARAASALQDAKAALELAEWQRDHDEIKQRHAMLAARVRAEYLPHAQAICELFAEIERANGDYVSFVNNRKRYPTEAIGESSIVHLLTLLNMRCLEELKLPGIDDQYYLWPMPKQTKPVWQEPTEPAAKQTPRYTGFTASYPSNERA